MTAWEILVDNSTIDPANIAWDHLNNQAGGGGDIYLSGGFGLNMRLEETALILDTEESTSIFLQQSSTTLTLKATSLTTTISETTI